MVKFVYLILLIGYTSIQAKVIVTDQQQQFFDNQENCESTGSCGLLKYWIDIKKKQVFLPGLAPKYAYHMTDIIAAYETEDIANIEDYAIVQFIKGCQYISSYDGLTVTDSLSISRHYFGDIVTFIHPTWMIDSDSSDPIYSSYLDVGRFALLKWNKDPNSTNPNTAQYYFRELPPHPIVFISDLPGGANLKTPIGGKQEAHNIWLEFKTCIYKYRDLPKQVDQVGSNITTSPLHCFHWDHKFVYDFNLKEFTEPAKMPDICLQGE